MEALNRKKNRFHLTRARAHLENSDTHRALRHLNKCNFGTDSDLLEEHDAVLEEQGAANIAEAQQLREGLHNHYKSQNDTELFKKIQADNGRIYHDHLHDKWLTQEPDDLHTWFELSPFEVAEPDGRKARLLSVTLVKKHGKMPRYISVPPIRLN